MIRPTQRHQPIDESLESESHSGRENHTMKDPLGRLKLTIIIRGALLEHALACVVLLFDHCQTFGSLVVSITVRGCLFCCANPRLSKLFLEFRGGWQNVISLLQTHCKSITYGLSPMGPDDFRIRSIQLYSRNVLVHLSFTQAAPDRSSGSWCGKLWLILWTNHLLKSQRRLWMRPADT